MNVLLAVAASIGMIPRLTAAQSVSPAERTAWIGGSGAARDVWDPWTSWSPLGRIGELGRGGAATLALPDLVASPSPRAGAFWIAGNPGALPIELDSSARTDFAASHANVSGAFRRPLDPVSFSTTGITAGGWQRFSGGGAAIGRAELERRQLSGGGTANLGVEPYSGSPFVPVDTTAPDANRSRVALEGAIGWARSGWGLGLGAAFEAVDARAEQARVGRVGRVSAPAANIGIVRTLPRGISVGLYARGQQRTERFTTLPITAPERVYELQGLIEPEAMELGIAGYARRVDRRASAGGVTVSGRAIGVAWVAYGETGGMREEQSSAEQANPPADRWTTSGYSLGLSLQRGAEGPGLHLTGHARYASLTGDASRPDLTGRTYGARERLWRAEGEARYQPSGNHWSGALRGFVLHDDRNQFDAVAELYTTNVAWSSGGALAVGRVPLHGLSVSAAAGAVLYSPSSTLPVTDSLGPVFQRFVAPELDYYATPMLATSGAATFGWHGTRGPGYWVRVEYSALSDRLKSNDGELRPVGHRSSLMVSVGLTLRQVRLNQ